MLSFKASPGIRDPLPLEWIITPVRLLTWFCSTHQNSPPYVCGEFTHLQVCTLGVTNLETPLFPFPLLQSLGPDQALTS